MNIKIWLRFGLAILVVGIISLGIGAEGCPWSKDTTSGSSGEFSAPSGLKACPSATSQVGIRLTWTDNSDYEDVFKVERSSDGVTFTQIATAGSNVYTDTGVASTTTYYHRVGVDFSGDSISYTNVASATTLFTIPFGDASTDPVDGGAYAIGDFDNDGNLDIATGADHTCSDHYDPDQLGIHLSNGDGTFQSRVDYDTGINIVRIISADVDNDSNIDIITFSGEQGDEEGKINVHLNNGSGVFTKTSYTVASGIIRWEVDMLASDVNNDNNIDVITCSDGVGGCRVSVLTGTGIGAFQSAVNYDIPEGATSVRAGDLDNDSDIDLVTTSRDCGATGVNKVGVLLNDGDGTFAPVVEYDHDYDALYNVTITDINSDSKPDLVTGSLGGIGIYPGNDDGTFQPPTHYDTMTLPTTLIVTDYNGDSKLDFIIGSGNGYGIFVHLGTGDGTVPEGTRYTMGNVGNLQKCDINNDGKADLVWAIVGYGVPGSGYANSWVGILLGK